jgi:inosose dehydratase
MVANAPVSFGAFEITVGDPNLPAGAEVLDWVARAGYDGIDLGPVGYLGTGPELAGRLESRGLGLSGGYIAMPFSQPQSMPAAIQELHQLLDIFDAVQSRHRGALQPKPTLADAGSDHRRAFPGRSQHDRRLGLDRDGWLRLAGGVRLAVEACRARRYEPTFHHHAGTYVEAPWEIEELLARTEVGLCLDTGHLMLGGGDPNEALREWGERINHVHLKDIRLPVINSLVAAQAPMIEVWRQRAFCPLGDGDLEVDRVLDALKARGYQDWLVVEQDTIPDTTVPRDLAARDQERNRAYLRVRGV